jgi:hypothetical protein
MRKAERKHPFAAMLSAGFLFSVTGCGTSGSELGRRADEPVQMLDAGGTSAGSMDSATANGSTQTRPGCTVTDHEFAVLPAELDGFGSVARLALGAAGTWTNAAGDRLTVAPAASGRFHESTGDARRGTRGGLPLPCSADSYVALETHVSLATKDGRFDEQLDVSLLLFEGSQGHIKIDIPLDSLNGTFHVNEPNDGVLRVSADYGVSKPSWNLGASVDEVVPQGSATVGFGAAKSVYIAPFDERRAP